MAWRRLSPDHGYCGMCPIQPDSHKDYRDVEDQEGV